MDSNNYVCDFNSHRTFLFSSKEILSMLEEIERFDNWGRYYLNKEWKSKEDRKTCETVDYE